MYSLVVTPIPQQRFIPTRQSLLSRLKDWKDHESWKLFFDTYWKLIYQTAVKAGLRDVEAEEVVQETVISVSKVMPTFEYDPAIGSFKSWLLQLTRWRISDQLRKRLPLPSGSDPSNVVQAQAEIDERLAGVQAPALETVWQEEWASNLMDAAIERVKRQVNPKHYQIFDYYVLHQWPVTKVAATLGISSGRVYMVKHRISSLVRKEIKRLEKGML